MLVTSSQEQSAEIAVAYVPFDVRHSEFRRETRFMKVEIAAIVAKSGMRGARAGIK